MLVIRSLGYSRGRSLSRFLSHLELDVISVLLPSSTAMAALPTPPGEEQVESKPAFPILNLKGDFLNELPYTPGPVLSKGMSGYVILATHRDKPSVRIAVKVMPLTTKLDKAIAESMFNRELGTFYNTDHRGLAKCIMAIRGADYLAIAMKFYPLGDLGRCVMTLPSTVQTWFAGRLSEAVAYLHHKRIVHGDIKLQNVFVDEGFAPVLGDFGLCRCIREEVLTITADRFGGTEHYWAPEIRDRDNQMLVDPFKVDTYALGVVILAVVALVKPTIDADYLVMVNISDRIPSCHRCILKRILDPDFTRRVTSYDVMTFYSKLL